MNPQRDTSFTITKVLLLFLGLSVASLLLTKGTLVPGIAQGPEKPSPTERVLENTIPKHVPIEIHIKKEKEKEFKNLKNERWAHDFEVEVTNTGHKPIYEFYLLLVTDIKAAAGYRIVAPLYYGRTELGDIRAIATPEDIPINPGESYVLKIHPGQLEAWDILQRKEQRPYPKKIQVVFQRLTFGDGTGYGPGGIAFPRAALKERRSESGG